MREELCMIRMENNRVGQCNRRSKRQVGDEDTRMSLMERNRKDSFIDVKKRFFAFFILVTFFTFFNVFYFPNVFFYF